MLFVLLAILDRRFFLALNTSESMVNVALFFFAELVQVICRMEYRKVLSFLLSAEGILHSQSLVLLGCTLIRGLK